MIVRLTFRAPQIVVRARVYANVPRRTPTTKKKTFRIEGKLLSNFTRPFFSRDRRGSLMLFITNIVVSNFFFTPVVKRN